jgi:dTDP-4-dehydrorhamnose reductase
VKVLVTGAGGQVGQALLATISKDLALIPCSHGELDISDEQAVLARLRQHAPHVVINTAAYTAVDRAESEPDLARNVNSLGPQFLARAAREIGARLIHLSTDFVFDGHSSVPYGPDAPTHPLSVYGATKCAGEQAVLAVPGLSALVLRTAWVYAAQGRNFLNTMLRLMKGKGPVRVVADQVGTPTAAMSLARVIWRLVELPQLTGIHHWTDAGVASWYDFAVAIAEEAATVGLLPANIEVLPISTDQYPTPARRPRYSVLDKSSLIALGVRPIHWRATLREVLREIGNA